MISFYVAHWQSQDAARQAIAVQQVQEVRQLEADAGTYDQAAASAYLSGLQCLHKIAAACKKADASTVVGSPLVAAQYELITDMGNVCDSTARTYAANLLDQVTGALAEEGSANGTTAWMDVGQAYGHLLSRCGQLIKEDD